jgi:hypothetical protein
MISQNNSLWRFQPDFAFSTKPPLLPSDRIKNFVKKSNLKLTVQVIIVSSRRREFVYQHGRSCCKWLVKRLDENTRILQQFKINELYLVKKLNLKFM